jgi:hypothetical protein
MTEPIALTPIGLVRGGRSQIFEDHWGAVVSRLVLDPAVLDPAATDGLSEFSHIEVVFHFHRETSKPSSPPTRSSRRRLINGRGHEHGCQPGAVWPLNFPYGWLWQSWIRDLAGAAPGPGGARRAGCRRYRLAPRGAGVGAVVVLSSGRGRPGQRRWPRPG